MRNLFYLLFFLFFHYTGIYAQNSFIRKNGFDVEKYDLYIQINENSNRIKVKEKITLTIIEKKDSIELDFISKTSDSTGMLVSSITYDEKQIQFNQKKDKLVLYLTENYKNKSISFLINFEGIPEDGLIIGNNKFGDKTFFADNWPTRAKHWFACIDHPSDKSHIRFEIDSPSKYTIVANGTLKSSTINKDRTITIYETEHQIPTKVMVFGAAEFVNETLSNNSITTITNYVYPQNKEKGLIDLKNADSILFFLCSKIGKYPFEKLANVQSTTRYGGMENASCIFYDENQFQGENRMNELITHELVHQWFGNSATELDFSHLWLSEGFATYLTNLWIEETKGENQFKAQLNKDRRRVINFSKKFNAPLEDHTTSTIQELLNPNAYQKGAWVLHMLRNQVGLDTFWRIVSSYYSKFQYANATTKDFIQVAENVSGLNLNQFYIDWFTKKGHPILNVNYHSNKSNIELEINQKQEELFHFPLELRIKYDDNSIENLKYQIQSKNEKFLLNTDKKIVSVQLDPEYKLLYEEVK